MSLLILYKGAVSAPFVSDSGSGTDTASAITGNFKVVSDQGISSDASSVVVPAPGVEILPQIALQLSFDAPAGPVYRESVTLAPAKVYYRLQEASGPVVDTMG